MNIGFTGSREWGARNTIPLFAMRKTEEIFLHTRRKFSEISVHVGDASGVDGWIVKQCDDWEIPLTIYGINMKWRNLDNRKDIKYIAPHQVSVPGNYLDRDRYLVDHVDFLIAIWNGVSRGTKYTFDYAKKQGKQVYVCRYTADGWKWNTP